MNDTILEGQLITLSEANDQMSVTIAKSRLSPQRLEEEFQKEDYRAKVYFGKGLDHYIKAGTFLCILKEKLGRGNWTPFLERNGLNQPNAFRRMELARYHSALPDLNDDTGEPWTYTDALTAIADMKRQKSVDVALDDLKSLETMEDLDVIEDINEVKPKQTRKMSGRNRVKRKMSRALMDLRQEFDTDPAIADDITHFIAELESMLTIEHE